MSLLEYLKEIKLSLLLVIFIMIIVNTVILLDPNLGKSMDTLIYINILVIFITSIFIIIGYKYYKRKIKKFIS